MPSHPCCPYMGMGQQRMLIVEASNPFSTRAAIARWSVGPHPYSSAILIGCPARSRKSISWLIAFFSSGTTPFLQYYAGKEAAHEEESAGRNLECGEDRRFLILFS